MLRKSPRRTPALLAANRLNALKSTGPRTVAGKARVALNSLKHGRYACRLRHTLLRAGDSPNADLYGRMRSAVSLAFRPQTPADYRAAERTAAQAWCRLFGQGDFGAKPECPLDAVGNLAGIPSMNWPGRVWGRFQVRDYRRRVGLTLWVQRRRCHGVLHPLVWTLESGCLLAPARLGEEWESALRWRIFRLGRPCLEEQLRYALDRDGRHRPHIRAECRVTIRRLRGQGMWPLSDFPMNRPTRESGSVAQ